MSVVEELTERELQLISKRRGKWITLELIKGEIPSRKLEDLGKAVEGLLR